MFSSRTQAFGGFMGTVALRLDLEGAVVDIEMVLQAFDEPPQHLTRGALLGAGIVDPNVCRQARYAAGDGPGVQIVQTDNAGDFPVMPPDGIQVDHAGPQHGTGS
jgi:hypothetical protein